jgi:hypothetical protein
MNRNSAVYTCLKSIYCFVFRNNKLLQLKYLFIGKLSGIDIKLEYTENPSSVHPDNVQYQPLYVWYLKKLMKCLSIKKYDRLFDYGSGKGAAMIFFARYPFCEIGGIELMYGLHETALKNIMKKKLNHLTSYNRNATEYGDIDRYNYFFFYNPFHGQIMEAVIDHIKNSLKRCPRKITIIYQNPEERDIFTNSGIFSYIAFCFVPSMLNKDKNNRRYGRQFIDVYSTDPLEYSLDKYRIQ